MSSPWKWVKPVKRALGKLGEPIPCLVDSMRDCRSINEKFKTTGIGGRREQFEATSCDVRARMGKARTAFTVLNKKWGTR